MKYALRFHFYSTFENYLWHDGGGRPAASAGSAARPAAGGRRPGQRGVPTLAAEADRERSTSAAARFILRVVEAIVPSCHCIGLCLIIVCVGTHLVNKSKYVRFEMFMWSSSSYMFWIHYLWHINTLILCNGIEWNVVIVGIYFTCLEAVFHFIYTLFWCT